MPGLRAIWAEVPGVLGLAVPIVLGLGAATLLGVTDSLMVAPLGELALAAVGLTTAAAAIVYVAIFGLLSALAVRVGRAFGARRGRQVPLILNSGLALGALVGAVGGLMMAAVLPLVPLLGQPPEVMAVIGPYWLAIATLMLPYGMLTAFKFTLEAIGRPWLATGFAFVGVVVNLPLNYALIWGLGPLPALGLLGAGVASLVAESAALALALAWWRFAPRARRLRLRRGPTRAEIGGTVREGAPLGALYVAETGAFSAATAIVGTFGVLALAANQVAMSVGAVLYMLPLGVAGAVAIRVAQECGAGRPGAVRAVAAAALGLATAWLSGSATLLLFGGGTIAALIAPGQHQVIALAAAIFAVLAAFQIMDGVQSTMLGALRGLGDTAWPAWVTLAAHWTVGLPLAWTFAHPLGFGPVGVWMGYGVGLGGAAAALLWRFVRRTAPGLAASTPGAA